MSESAGDPSAVWSRRRLPRLEGPIHSRILHGRRVRNERETRDAMQKHLLLKLKDYKLSHGQSFCFAAEERAAIGALLTVAFWSRFDCQGESFHNHVVYLATLYLAELHKYYLLSQCGCFRLFNLPQQGGMALWCVMRMNMLQCKNLHSQTREGFLIFIVNCFNCHFACSQVSHNVRNDDTSWIVRNWSYGGN